MVNPFTPKTDLIDFTLSNASQFYLSQGDPLGVKELRQEGTFCMNRIQRGKVYMLILVVNSLDLNNCLKNNGTYL